MPPLACRDGALCANRGLAGCASPASFTEGKGGECSMFSMYVRFRTLYVRRAVYLCIAC